MHQTFDTYKSVKALVAQGFKEPQAEVIVNAIAESREFDLSKLATKEQVNALAKVVEEKATKEQVNALRDEMRALIAESHASILKWMVATMITFSGVIIAAVAYLK